MALAAWFCGAIDADLEALVRHEVDDLAKFNLLHLMKRTRGLRADAATFARELGFHSVEQTEAKLRQLVRCGLVVAVADPLDGRTLYTLCDDEAARKRLAKLWRLAHREAYFASLLHHLAERSVEEAQAHYTASGKARPEPVEHP